MPLHVALRFILQLPGEYKLPYCTIYASQAAVGCARTAVLKGIQGLLAGVYSGRAAVALIKSHGCFLVACNQLVTFAVDRQSPFAFFPAPVILWRWKAKSKRSPN